MFRCKENRSRGKIAAYEEEKSTGHQEDEASV
jgi:hypothetical protein